MNKFLLLTVAAFFFYSGKAQHLKPGYDKKEFAEILKMDYLIAIDTSEWKNPSTIPALDQKYKFAYRSPLIGLQNMWDLWINQSEPIAVINIRGTDIKPNPVSWLVNYYAAMVPAKGKLELEKNFIFDYHLSDDDKAAVHVGFLVSTGYLSRDILPKIDSLYKKGIKEFIIAGHSQGGAITYLLTSYLEDMKTKNRIPGDIRFKTYSSASPKAGNLYYAYTYEALTRDWAFNSVSTADWVPEVPFSIQTVNDFTDVNPFKNVKPMMKKQKFGTRIVLKHVYKKLSKPALKAQRDYQKYLGDMVSIAVKKNLIEFKEPVYYETNNYVRIGTTVVLYADEEYRNLFPTKPEQIWLNHGIERYLYLTEKLK
ncbi:lipase [Sphingobacteriaceae bacterium]|nr:lipase [Sphingobacteriaceae bacterium]